MAIPDTSGIKFTPEQVRELEQQQKQAGALALRWMMEADADGFTTPTIIAALEIIFASLLSEAAKTIVVAENELGVFVTDDNRIDLFVANVKATLTEMRDQPDELPHG